MTLLVLTQQMDRPPNCDVYSFSLGTCWSCVDGYKLENNMCHSTQAYIVQTQATTGTGSTQQATTNYITNSNGQQGSSSTQGQSYNYNQQVVFPWNSNGQQTTTQTTSTGTGTVPLGISTNTQQTSGTTVTSGREAFTYSDMHCRKPDPLETRCEDCSHYYYYDAGLGRCVPVSDQCNGYQKWDGKCTDCWPGYKLKNGVPGEC